MKILDNGLVEIQNKNTGEVKQVAPEQLASHSPFLANQYYNHMDEIRKNKEKGGAGGANIGAYLGGTNNLETQTPEMPTEQRSLSDATYTVPNVTTNPFDIFKPQETQLPNMQSFVKEQERKKNTQLGTDAYNKMFPNLLSK